MTVESMKDLNPDILCPCNASMDFWTGKRKNIPNRQIDNHPGGRSGEGPQAASFQKPVHKTGDLRTQEKGKRRIDFNLIQRLQKWLILNWGRE